MMIILGVDPGMRVTGYGLISVSPGTSSRMVLLEAGVIEPKGKAELSTRIHAIYRHLSEIVLQHHPSVMVLEKLYSHYRHPTTACLLGHVRGVICLVAAQQVLTLVEHSVKRVRKSLVGDGSASKVQTRNAVMHILNLQEQTVPLDTSDALALALGYAYMNRQLK